MTALQFAETLAETQPLAVLTYRHPFTDELVKVERPDVESLLLIAKAIRRNCRVNYGMTLRHDWFTYSYRNCDGIWEGPFIA